MTRKREPEAELASWTERREQMERVRGGPLVLPKNDAELAELQAQLARNARAVLNDLLLNSPNERTQLRAIELAIALEESMAPALRLPSGKMVQAQVVDEQPTAAVVVPEAEVTRISELLMLRRRLQNGGQ